MRIAVLYTPLVTRGGAERQALEEVAHLKRRGHDVTLLTFRLSEEALFVEGVTRRDVEVLASRGGVSKMLALRGALRRIAPDVLLCHTSPELTWLSTRFMDVPYVQYHNSPPFYIGIDANPYMASRRYRRVFRRVRGDVAGYAELAAQAPAPHRALIGEVRAFLKHRALRGAAQVVVLSQRTARELRMLHGVEATVVRGCLPSQTGSTTRDRGIGQAVEPLFLSVCRLERVKRIDLLLRAFALVAEHLPEARLIVAGEGPDLPRLRAVARALDIGDRVEFAGHVAEEALDALYDSADVFVAPAMADFNIAPYEAMARGCTVVWSDEMETDPEIEASGQVIVAPPDASSFAEAMLDALRAPSRGRADLSGMTWEARAGRIESLIDAGERRIAA